MIMEKSSRLREVQVECAEVDVLDRRRAQFKLYLPANDGFVVVVIIACSLREAFDLPP